MRYCPTCKQMVLAERDEPSEDGSDSPEFDIVYRCPEDNTVLGE